MSIFDKLCASLAFVLGGLLLVLGGIGLFAGCSANFSLPPVFGIFPAFVGWGIVRTVYVAWTRARPPAVVDSSAESEMFDPPAGPARDPMREIRTRRGPGRL